MSSRTARLLATIVALVLGVAATAQAQWQTTTFNQIVGHPDITSMALADQYFAGTRPQRFNATSTVPRVDLFENGGDGQFTFNHPFPGCDNMPAVGDTNDYTARATGTLRADVAGPYDFFTDSDDGNRFRLDLNRNGTFEDATESIVPDGGLQGAGTPERSAIITLATGNYPFEISFFERGGGASFDAGYRVNGTGTQHVIGSAAGGIGVVGDINVRAVGARTGGGGPDITNFALADALRTSPNEPGFPVTEFRDVFNIVDSGGDAAFPGGQGAPGLGAPGANDDDDFVVVGTGFLIVPPTGITGAIFRSNTDDGGRLRIDTNQDGDLTDPGDVIINADVLQGPTNTDSSPVTLAGGTYLVEYSFFERGGGAEGEVSVNLGGGFRLLGEDASVLAGTSLNVVPEPSTIILASLAVLGAVGTLRRRK